jgi:ATP-dependent DNA helicase RecG
MMPAGPLNEAALRRLMTDDEGERLEFKEKLLDRKEVGEYAVALSNEGGGRLILGVTNRKPRCIVGIPMLSPEDVQKLRDSVLDATSIRVTPEQIPTKDGVVLVVNAPPRPRGQVCSTKSGKFLMRSGEGLRGMTLAEIERIRSEELRPPDFSAEIVPESWQRVLDPLEFQRLRRVLIENDRDELARQGDEELLRSLELLGSGRRRLQPTRAAVLLLGTDAAIHEYAPTHEIKLQRFDRDELTPSFSEDLRIPLLAAVQRAREVIEVVNSAEPVQVGLFRTDVSKFPERAYREALANAVVHRDYRITGNTAVRVYQSRMELGSPGGWYGSVNESNILVSESQRRNELLASVFQRIGLAERSALGVKRMFLAMLRSGKEPPAFRSTATSITVTLYDGSFDRDFAAFSRSCAEEGIDLTVFELLLLAYLRRHREITVSEAARLCQWDAQAARRLLDELRNRGLVDRRGETKGRHYLLGPLAYERLNLAADRPLDLGMSEQTFEGLLIDELERRKERGITSGEVREWSRHGKAQTTSLLAALRKRAVICSSGKRGKGARYWLPQYAPEIPSEGSMGADHGN